MTAPILPAPGTRLVELQLAREFGVSQAPVREALRERSSTRLVESLPPARNLRPRPLPG
ncbi:GntR family transcriptional regulator [Arthrobacter sp. PAMC25564]|uniref:GntR family transcriptional regulator n=1 Tax=Arthrobacter sp. PAMC25564 TaxID=2565366 RepID=UPI001F110F37|nr:GntR family transcriptional regulator [Arthrobacter sp. PAMC25564]